jgi:hypothetical protein
MHQSLHDDTIPLAPFTESLQLFRRGLGSKDVKPQADPLETYRGIARNPERPSQVQIPLNGDLDAFGPYLHGRGHHLTGNLGACRQGSQ